MADYRADPEKMMEGSRQVRSLAEIVGQYAQDVRSVERNLQIQNNLGWGIRQSLGHLSQTLEEDSRKTNALSDGLEKAALFYGQTEEKISQYYSGKLEKKLSGKNESAEGGKGEAKAKFDTDRKVSWAQGVLAGQGEFLGAETSGRLEGELLGASWKPEFSTGIIWKEEKDKDGNTVRRLSDLSLITAAVAGEVYVAKGSAKGNWGYLRGEAQGSVGQISAKGEIGAALFKDGKFAPQIGAKAEASAVGIQGKAEAGIGTENNNIHVGADGKVGVAKAGAEAGIGKVTHTNANGKAIEGYGIKAEAGAEAYAAEGRLSGGLEIFGIRIDAGITGKAGGAGVKAGGAVTTGGVSGNIGAGFGLGVGIDISIDWSNFKWGW